MPVIIPIIIPNGAAAAAMAAQHRAECRAFMPGYQHVTASLDQMKAYGQCVELLYPTANDALTLWIKAAILAVFIGVIIGIWMWRDDYIADSWFGRAVFGALIGSVCGALVVMAVAGLYYGALFLVK